MDSYFRRFHAKNNFIFFFIKKTEGKDELTSASSKGDGGRAKNCSCDVKPESCDETLDILHTPPLT